MNIKRFIWAVVAVFVAIQITDPLIHSFLLAKSYAALKDLWRPNMMSKMWIMLLNYLMFSILFVYIFSKGREGKGIIEGIRFGIIAGFFVYIFSILNQYVVYPLPFSLVLQWGIYGIIQYALYGIVTALIYIPKTNS
jgi:hypothetical protein